MVRTATITFAIACMTFVAFGVRAQQPGFTRTILQQGDISAPGREAVTAVGEFQPGASAAPHTHPGEEVGYILEGTVVVSQAGQPDKTVTAGKTFLIPANTVHSAVNKGPGVARILATYIVEKGKPLATPAATR
jgi:quercetin dioxygenase-like cupin family protein